MLKITAALILLAACNKPAGRCSAVVSGTGTSADGAYTCQVPPNGYYSETTMTGGFQGFALSDKGLVLAFSVTTMGRPALATYTETSSSGTVTNVVITSGNTLLWEAGSPTGDGPVALEVTALNVRSGLYPNEIWPLVSGNLNARLKPSQGNAASTSATVSMTF
jgi:hypothetical protein